MFYSLILAPAFGLLTPLNTNLLEFSVGSAISPFTFIFNSSKPNVIFHSYKLDQCISVLRVAGCYFSFYSKI